MLDSRFRLPYGSRQSEIPTRAGPTAGAPSQSWLVKIIRTAGYFSRNWPAHPINIGGGETVHAEGVGNLAAVMYVVLDDVPDDPSAGVGVYLAFPLILDRRLQIRERIASQHLLHDLPGFFQSAHQLIRRAW